jgi:hypothetical protein
MLDIFGHKQNANQNDTEISPHSSENGYHLKHNNKCCQGTLMHCQWECKLVQLL